MVVASVGLERDSVLGSWRLLEGKDTRYRQQWHRVYTILATCRFKSAKNIITAITFLKVYIHDTAHLEIFLHVGCIYGIKYSDRSSQS